MSWSSCFNCLCCGKFPISTFHERKSLPWTKKVTNACSFNSFMQVAKRVIIVIITLWLTNSFSPTSPSIEEALDGSNRGIFIITLYLGISHNWAWGHWTKLEKHYVTDGGGTQRWWHVLWLPPVCLYLACTPAVLLAMSQSAAFFYNALIIVLTENWRKRSAGGLDKQLFTKMFTKSI